MVSGWGESIFDPQRVALVGASNKQGKLGHLFMRNLAQGYSGKVYPIHPLEKRIRGRSAYPSIADTPEPADLAVILLSPERVEQTIEDCLTSRVKAALIISSGFADCGEEGARLQQRIVERVRSSELRFVGPNSFGIINTRNGLNASLGFGTPLLGGVSLVTQSGAYGMAAFTRSREGDIGFAKVLALGNSADIDELEALRYLGEDAETRVIAMVLESIKDARSFYDIATQITRRKAIVLLKTGRGKSGQRAAESHTAAIVNDHRVTKAAMRQAGVRVVEDGLSLLDTAAALERQPPLRGKRVAIVTNSGGTGVELTDLLEERGLEVPRLSDPLQAKIKHHLPAYGSAINPVDVTTDWERFPEMYGESIRALLACDEVDAVVPVLLQRSALSSEVGDRIVTELEQARRNGCDKPLHVCWISGSDGETNRKRLLRAKIPCHPWTSRTAQALARCLEIPRHIEPTPEAVSVREPRSNLKNGWLQPNEVFALLEDTGLPVTSHRMAENDKAAISAAQEIGFPVVVKAIRPGIMHKSLAGAISLDIHGLDALKHALAQCENRFGPGPYLVQTQVARGFELMLGAVRDRQFGPVIVFGPGGVWVEALADKSIRLAPISEEGALNMLSDVSSQTLTDALNHAKTSRQQLASIIAEFSKWVASTPWLKELDLNPLIVNQDGLHVVDARICVSRMEAIECD